MSDARPVVLAVDDTPANLEVLSAILRKDYRVKVATNGLKALELAGGEPPPDIILLDIMMPEMSGYEVCERLKVDPATSAIPVIFLTAMSDVEDERRGLELGAVDYITKPFHADIVTARLSRHLQSHERARQLEQENRALRNITPQAFTDFEEEGLLELIASGEHHALEFKATLRWNLHAERNDKNIENASLKTVAGYLNSEGGVLLVGVTDDGQPIGLDQDGFRSEDKMLLHWADLLRQSLGGEFSRNLRSTLHTVSGNRVLVVQCLPAKAPVFFSRDQDELFYVRTSASTQALRPSEILAYINQHFAPGGGTVGRLGGAGPLSHASPVVSWPQELQQRRTVAAGVPTGADATPVGSPDPTPADGRLDRTSLSDFLEDVGAEVFPRLVDAYLDEIRKRVESLPGELEGGRLDAVERFAHDIKACAGRLGASELRKEAAALERVARARDAAAAAPLAARVVDLAQEAVPLAESLRDELVD